MNRESRMNSHPLTETFDQMLREELPNLFRLYINPHVVQACFCLERYIQTTWAGVGANAEYQTFLANGFDERWAERSSLPVTIAALPALPR